MELQNNELQKVFYSFLEGKNVTFYLANMHSVYGKVLATDNFTILLRPLNKEDVGLGKTNLIYKSSIVNVEIDEKLNIKDYLYKQTHPSTKEESAEQKKANKNSKKQSNSTKSNDKKESNSKGIEKTDKDNLMPLKKSTETIETSFQIPNKQNDNQNFSQDALDSLPDINIEPTPDEDLKKVDNEENISENEKEQAKYSPMSFLNDLSK